MFTTQMAAIKNSVELSVMAEETLNLRRKDKNYDFYISYISFHIFCSVTFSSCKTK